MSIDKNALIGAEHPLFRALVLMGSGLALSCGGISQNERSTPADAAGAGSTGLGGSGSALGSAGTSAAGSPGLIVIAGTAGYAGGAEYDAGPPLDLKCPYAQWACAPACYLLLANSGDPADSGCTCDTSRPTAQASCAANETLVCLQASLPSSAAPTAVTWAGTVNVSCSCVVVPPTAQYVDCRAVCRQALPPSAQVSGVSEASCIVRTCSAGAACTANDSNVLLQDGIMCNCADISLR